MKFQGVLGDIRDVSKGFQRVFGVQRGVRDVQGGSRAESDGFRDSEGSGGY